MAQSGAPGLLTEKAILILHGHEANAPLFQETDRTLARTLQAGGIPLLSQFYESLDLRRNPGPEYRGRLVEYLSVKYRHRKFDLIITMFPEALDFVLNEGRTLFPDVPVLALYLPVDAQPPVTNRLVIRHSATLDMLGTLEIALKLVPNARHVYVVSGAHEFDRQQEERARQDFKKWEDRLEFHYLSRMTVEEVLTILANAPPDAVVLFLVYSTDVRGTNYTAPDLVQRLSQVSKAPVFGLLDVELGHGIVGGGLINYERIGTKAGLLVLDFLRGSPTSGNVASVLDVPAVPMFDWRQLKRWHLSVNALPPGSIVINREYTLWEQHHWEAIGAIVLLIVQALLILALVLHRQRRRKAEEMLRENEGRLRLAMSSAALDVWSWDIPRDRIRLSQQVGKMLPETPKAEVTYKDFLALVQPEDRERVDAAIHRAIQAGREYECDFRLAHRDGTVQWISSRGSCLYNRSGPLRMSGVSQDITERKRAELAVQESEQRFRKMTDAAHIMVWMSGPDKGCIYFNQSWLTFTGRRMEQEVGDGWTEGVHPEDLERIIRGYSRAFDAREAFQLEYRLRHFDGEYRWIVDVGTPLYEDDGRFCGYLGSCLDITERKRGEEERQLLAAVVESSHNAILSFGPDLEIASWNPGAERLFGYTAAEVKGRPVWFLVPPEAREETGRALERVKAGQAISWESVRCRKDGTPIQVSISSAPIRNNAGEIVGVTTTLHDITERKRAEEALKESEERFRTLFEESPLAIGVSREGEILYTNKKYLEMFGYENVEELRGRLVREQWAPESHEELAKRSLRRDLGLPVSSEFEGRGLRKDGSQFPVHAFATRVQLADGMASIVFLTDVTERKRAEGETDRLRRELAHMSRVTMMGELTASLAHELNQPLTAIVSNAHAGERYLATSTPPLGELREILTDVAADAQRAGEVIRRLRGLLKKDTTRFLPLDLNELIREVVALTQTDALIRHHPIALALAPELPPVRGDRVQLQQVLLNLVLNGMEAMEPQPPAARQLSIQTLSAGATVHVGVADQGPGVPPEKLETIFDAFFTTKTQGLGMGLAISRSIVEAHGGRIWAENNPERGATFWFSLPV